MKDIAEALGVSLMTVSKALRGHTDISEETRARVAECARKLDYRPNWIARSLVTRRTYLVGLVIPDLMHSFFAEVAKGVERKLGPLGYQIVISNSGEDAVTEDRQLEMLAGRSVDGLIVASAASNAAKGMLRDVMQREIPVVLIDRMPAGVEANFVGCRDEDIGALATRHLIEQGCRRIAHIRGRQLPNSNARLRGYRRALEKHGLRYAPELVAAGAFDDSGGYAAMRTLLSLTPPPDGVFCYNDPVAAGAIKAALEAGLDVPRQLAIIGAGNVHYSDLLLIPLSTIDQRSAFIGEEAAAMLVECIEAKTAPPPRRVLVPPRLVVRESSRRK
jgi:LacI family transcriptional regulator